MGLMTVDDKSGGKFLWTDQALMFHTASSAKVGRRTGTSISKSSGLAPTAAVAKARRENKAWNQNKGGDARVERSSTAAVTGMMSPQD